MSKRRNRTRDRRKITRRSAYRRRFARAETLEPRVVLDGGGLGQIAPDFLPTIPLPETMWVVQDAIESSDDDGADFTTITRADGSLLSILDIDLSFALAPVTGTAAVASPTGNLSFVVTDRANLGDLDAGQGNGQEFRDSPLLDNIADNGTQVDDLSRERTSKTSAGGVSVVAIPPLMNTDSIPHQVVVGDSAGEFEITGRLSDNETPGNHPNRIVIGDHASKRLGGLRPAGDFTLLADHPVSQGLADPGVIALPEPEAGFLPADRASRHDPAGRPAPSAIQQMIATADPPAKESLNATSPNAESQPESTSTQIAARPADRVSRGAESGATTALSADRYFASYQQRTPVAWSTQSAASEMRRHVRPTSYQDGWGEAQANAAVGVAHRASSLVVAGGGENASGRWLLTIAGEQAELATGGWMGSTASQWLTVCDTSETGLAEQGVIEAGGHELASQTTAAPLPARLYQLAMTPYQPLAVLVGVSLVSAHVIADASPQSVRRKKQSRLR